MLSIKTKIKLKSLKRKLISIWYALMKPVAYVVNKTEKYIYKRKQDMISKWSDEYAIKLYSKILIKQLINHKWSYEHFIVAEWCADDCGLRNIRDCIINQRENKNLRSWGYKLPWRDVDRIEKLTELLRLELESYSEIKCEYIVEDKIPSYQVREYRKTLVVELNIAKGECVKYDI